MSQHPYLLVMQENASFHKAAHTMREFERRGMAPIEWPPYSPDLNPIEYVWSYTKDYMQSRYPGLENGRNRSRTQFRQVVQEAWDNWFNGDDLDKLMESKPRRMRAVYAAQGGYTKY